ncbi:perlucin-like protein [Crassostrea virginica]
MNSKRICEENGGSLASVRSSEENSWIVDTFLPPWNADLCIYYWDCCDHWIGGSDRDVEGTFVWSSDNSTLGFVNWYPGEPRDFHNEDCMTLCREEHWNDNNCDSFYPYICKTHAM